MTSVASNAACKREIQVEVPADVVAQETEAVIGKLQRMARLPGFRRGKVPATVIRQRFADDIRSEVVEALVPKYFRKEVASQKLMPVSQPQVSDLHIHDGEPLRFKASFEVLPDFEVTGYSELRAEHHEIKIGDDEVEQQLNQLRERQATYTPIEDRALADSDYAQVAFTGTPAEGGKPVNVDDVLVEIGGAGTIPEFSDNLRGLKPGEEKTFDVKYPDDFSDQRLAGKTFSYHASVKGVKQKQLPEVNDDFAKELGSFTSLDDLKSKIREGLEAEKKHTAEHAAKDKLVEELVKRNSFEVPEALVEHQVDLRLERGLRALAAQGLRQEDLKRMDLPRLRAGQREAAEREVRASLILERIAEKENIQVAEDEVEKEIQALAEQARQPVETVRARLTHDGALDRIRARIRSEKTLDFLFRRSA